MYSSIVSSESQSLTVGILEFRYVELLVGCDDAVQMVRASNRGDALFCGPIRSKQIAHPWSTVHDLGTICRR